MDADESLPDAETNYQTFTVPLAAATVLPPEGAIGQLEMMPDEVRGALTSRRTYRLPTWPLLFPASSFELNRLTMPMRRETERRRD